MIRGHCFAKEAPNPNDWCQQCNISVDQRSWTRRMSKLPVKLQFGDAFFKSLTRTHLKGLHMIRKQWFLFGAKICRNVCSRTLSVSRCEQFSESEAQGNL